MRTLDGAALIAKSIESKYSKYPEGSISRREVFAELPPTVNAEEVNAAITKAIYDAASAYVKTVVPHTRQEKVSFKTAADHQSKADDKEIRNKALSSAVQSILQTFN